jgi:polyphenol oxidase
MSASWLEPDWPAPPNVHARVTLRQSPGISSPPFDRCNLGSRCGDDPAHVAANRAGLIGALGMPSAPRWLQQVHGHAVAPLVGGVDDDAKPEADAATTETAATVLAVLTADCLPVIVCRRDGSAVGIAHAGWRGLAAGVIDATCRQLATSGTDLMAWLGPAIGAASYEVGAEVRAAFVDTDAGAADAFAATRPGHWTCDLAALARRRLASVGVGHVFGGDFDTRNDARFYSYRRDARTGRFATLVWRD